MRINLSRYSTLIFDCDGVILDSNNIKTEAFRQAALPWGEAAADALVAHHVANGGISRHNKFSHFLEVILPEYKPDGIPGIHGPGFEELLSAYADEVRSGLMSCPVVTGLETLRSATSHASWCIVSGGDQTELREVFAARGLAQLFNGGIFGSPDSKDIILARELHSKAINLPALFLGDSRYDYESAVRAGADFIFVSDWTDVSEWKDFVNCHNLCSIERLDNLLEVSLGL